MVKDTPLNAVGLINKKVDPQTNLIMIEVLWEDGKSTWELRKDLIQDGLREHVKNFDASRRKGKAGWFAEDHLAIIAKYMAAHPKPAPKASASKGKGKGRSASKAAAAEVEEEEEEEVVEAPKSRSKTPKRASSPARSKGKKAAARAASPAKKAKSPAKAKKAASPGKAKRAASPRRTKAATKAPVEEPDTDEEEEEERRRSIGDTVSRAVAAAAASVVRSAVPSMSLADDSDEQQWLQEDAVAPISALKLAQRPAAGSADEEDDEEEVADEEVGAGARASSGVATAFGAASRIRFHGGGRPITPVMTLILAVILFVTVTVVPDDIIAMVTPASNTIKDARASMAAIFLLLSPFHAIFSNAAGESSSAAQVRYTLGAMIAALASSHPHWRLSLTAAIPNLEALISLALAVSLLWAGLATAAGSKPSHASWTIAVVVVGCLAVASHPAILESATAALAAVPAALFGAVAPAVEAEANDAANETATAAATAAATGAALVTGVVAAIWSSVWTAVSAAWTAVTTFSQLTAGIHAAAAVAAVARAVESGRWQDVVGALGTLGVSHPLWVESALTARLASIKAASVKQASTLAMGVSFAALAVGCDDDNAGDESAGRIADVKGYDE